MIPNRAQVCFYRVQITLNILFREPETNNRATMTRQNIFSTFLFRTLKIARHSTICYVRPDEFHRAFFIFPPQIRAQFCYRRHISHRFRTRFQAPK